MRRRGGFRKSGRFRKVAIRQAATLGGRVHIGVLSPALDVSVMRNLGDEHVTWGLTGWVTCPLCAQPVDLTEATIDHIVPVAVGGTDGLHNLQLVHPDCNNVKGSHYGETEGGISDRPHRALLEPDSKGNSESNHT